MRKIVHLSDLHFGKVEKKRIAPLLNIVNKAKPDLIIISGDLTQRAKKNEYKEARKFLRKLRAPLFIIPGNHDIPLYNIFARIISPFKRYKEHISKDLTPVYIDKEMAIVGVNSVKPYKISSGRIGKDQVSRAEEIFEGLHSKVVKIVVCHHPFDLPHSLNTHHKHTHKVIGRSKFAMKRLAQKRVDLFLSGHLHVTHIGDTTMRYKIKGYSGLIAQAGTAISKRRRGEPVSFNIISLKRDEIKIETWSGDARSAEFSHGKPWRFERYSDGWRKVDD